MGLPFEFTNSVRWILFIKKIKAEEKITQFYNGGIICKVGKMKKLDLEVIEPTVWSQF